MLSLLKRDKTKKILYYSILALFSFYLFSTTAFNEIYGLHYINYFLMALLGISVLLYDVLYLKKIFITRQMFMILTFVLYAAVVTLINKADFSRIVTMFVIFGSFVVMYFAIRILNNNLLLFISLFFAAFAYLIFFIAMSWNEIISLEFLNGRLGGNIGNENNVGINLLMYSSMFCVAALNKKRWYFAFGSIPFIVLTFFTGSKKVFLGFVLLVVVVLFYIFRHRKIIFLLSLSLCLILLFLTLQLAIFSTLRERIFEMIISIFTGSGSTSTELREIYSEIGLYLGGQNLFFGLGAEGFRLNTNFGTYSHNNFVEIFCDFGLIGFMLFYLPLIYVIFSIKRFHSSKIYFFAFFMILFLFVMGFAMIFYYSKTLAIFYAFAFGSIEEGAFTYKKQLVI